MTREQRVTEINKVPLKRRAEYKRSVNEHGLDSEFVLDAVQHHKKLISWMVEDLRRGPYLAGDTFTDADCAVIPYILRLELLKLNAMWKAEPAVVDWWAPMQSRPSVKAAIFERMEETDWAPFKKFLSPSGRIITSNNQPSQGRRNGQPDFTACDRCGGGDGR